MYKSLSLLAVPCIQLIDSMYIVSYSAMFHDGAPIYSAKNVRFRMGYCRYTHEKDEIHRNDYVWLYVSPVYPMAQVSCLAARSKHFSYALHQYKFCAVSYCFQYFMLSASYISLRLSG